MSLPKERGQRSFFDVSFALKELFEPNDRFRLFLERIMPALRRRQATLDSMYCRENGRPATDPVILAGATLLQYMEKRPDREATECVRLHLGWKLGLGLEVDYKGFHPTTLTNFRERLAEKGAEREIFDAILKTLQEEGWIRKDAKQRLDSTHVLGLISEMSKLELVRETLRLALEELEKTGKEKELAGWETLKERYCEGRPDWREADREKLKEKLREAGEDALRVKKWLETQPEELRRAERMKLLERVFEEQFELREGRVERREKQLSGTVCNPHDADAQWAQKDAKGKKTWTGYKAQVMETVGEDEKPKKKGEPTEQFITEVLTTEAISSDIAGMRAVLEKQKEEGNEAPKELYVDAGYVTDDTLGEAQKEGRELTGPARPAPEKNGVFSVEEFDVSVERKEAVCPAGKKSTQCSHIHDGHHGREYYRFEWGGQCDGCGLKEQCTKSGSGRRIVAVEKHHDLLQKRREEMKTEEYKRRRRQRNGIEGTISELKRYGLRRSRYRGLKKTRLANYFIGSACNVNRWIRRMRWAEGCA